MLDNTINEPESTQSRLHAPPETVRISEADVPFKLTPPKGPITNEDFMRTVFRDLPAGAVCWVTAFDGDPKAADRSAWNGWSFDLNQTLKAQADQNTYFSISTFIGDPDPGHPGVRFGVARRKALHAATHCLVLDDIGGGPGAKISLEHLPAGLVPTWMLETSPGNLQVGYALRTPETNGPLVARVLDALVSEGLQAEKDPGMKGVTRYMRMVVGMNWKPAFTNGTGWKHRLLHWRPKIRYDLDRVGEAFGLNMDAVRAGAGTGDRIGASDLTMVTDPWVDVLGQAFEMRGSPTDKGPDGVWIDMECPWEHEHTGQDGDGAAYAVGGGFKCHHGHCEHRDFGSLKGALFVHDDPTVRQAAIAIAVEDAFGLAELFMPEAPPAPERPEAGSAEPVPVRTYEHLLKEIEGELTGDVAESMSVRVSSLLQDIAAAVDARVVDAVGEDALIARIHDKTDRRKATLEKQLKWFKGERRDAAKLAKANARIAASMREANVPGRLTVPVLPAGELDEDEDGRVLITTNNFEKLMAAAGIGARFNRMTLEDEYTGVDAKLGNNGVIRFLQDCMECNKMQRNQQGAVSMLRAVAAGNTYHPMQQFLEELKRDGGWDGVDRLRAKDGLFETIILAKADDPDDDARARANKILSKWLYSVIAAARHLYEGRPGGQPRGVLVFTSGQHTGKTTWLARLFDGLFPGSNRCFVGGAHFTGTTDDKLNVLGALVTELGEIDSTMNRSEAGQLKAFLSNDMDRIRRPYAAAHEDLPRRTVFSGTVNSTEFLRDPTGNTRFWTIAIKEADLDKQRKLDMRQIWAQLQHECFEYLETAERNMDAHDEYTPLPWQTSAAEVELFEKSNDKHRVLSEEEEWLLGTFDWEHAEWVAAKGDMPSRLKINAMSLHEIKAERGAPKTCGIKAWTDALKRLTGCPKVLHGRVEVDDWKVVDGETVKTGTTTKKMGRHWPMPPKFDPNRADKPS